MTEIKQKALTELKFFGQREDGCWFAVGKQGKVAVVRFKSTKGAARAEIMKASLPVLAFGFAQHGEGAIELRMDEAKFPQVKIAFREWLKVAGKSRVVSLGGPMPADGDDAEPAADDAAGTAGSDDPTPADEGPSGDAFDDDDSSDDDSSDDDGSDDDGSDDEDGSDDDSSDDDESDDDGSDEDDWSDEDGESVPLSEQAAAQVARTAESLAAYIQRIEKGGDADQIARDSALTLAAFLEDYLPPDADDAERDELAANFLARVFLRARPAASVPDADASVLGVALNTVGAGPLSVPEVVAELCHDLERLVEMHADIQVSSGLLRTDRFEAWAERVMQAGDQTDEIERIKSTLAKVFLDGKGDTTFGIEAARTAREPARRQAFDILRRAMEAKAAINAAFDGFAATFGAEADATALAAQGLVMIVQPKAIQAQADEVRRQVVGALDGVASVAMKYPFSRVDPAPAVSALEAVAAGGLSARADALLASAGQGSPIGPGLASVLQAARLLTLAPAA